MECVILTPMNTISHSLSTTFSSTSHHDDIAVLPDGSYCMSGFVGRTALVKRNRLENPNTAPGKVTEFNGRKAMVVRPAYNGFVIVLLESDQKNQKPVGYLSKSLWKQITGGLAELAAGEL